MKIAKLGYESVGFHLTDVFEPDVFQYLLSYCDEFIPQHIRLDTGSESIRRESTILDTHRSKAFKKQWSSKISQFIDKLDTMTIELWRDFPGYRNVLHVDDATVNHVIIVYLNDTGEATDQLGTEFIESDGVRYVVQNQANQGLLLLNSDQIQHGMVGVVPAGHIRKIFYINIQKL